MKREPIFGSNAKAFFIQMAAAVAIGLALSYYAGPVIEVWAKWLVRMIFSAFE